MAGVIVSLLQWLLEGVLPPSEGLGRPTGPLLRSLGSTRSSGLSGLSGIGYVGRPGRAAGQGSGFPRPETRQTRYPGLVDDAEDVALVQFEVSFQK